MFVKMWSRTLRNGTIIAVHIKANFQEDFFGFVACHKIDVHKMEYDYK